MAGDPQDAAHGIGIVHRARLANGTGVAGQDARHDQQEGQQHQADLEVPGHRGDTPPGQVRRFAPGEAVRDKHPGQDRARCEGEKSQVSTFSQPGDQPVADRGSADEEMKQEEGDGSEDQRRHGDGSRGLARQARPLRLRCQVKRLFEDGAFAVAAAQGQGPAHGIE